ncbi:hypothetical protein AB0J27_06975 [Micromonospora chokoriensis]
MSNLGQLYRHDLSEAYGHLPNDDGTFNDRPLDRFLAGVMVWVSDPDHCRVERRGGGRDLHLVESGTNVLPRARGLEILRAPDADHRWVHSLDWRWGAGEYLDRDRVGAIVDRALDMEPWAVSPEGPVGLAHLSATRSDANSSRRQRIGTSDRRLFER